MSSAKRPRLSPLEALGADVLRLLLAGKWDARAVAGLQQHTAAFPRPGPDDEDSVVADRLHRLLKAKPAQARGRMLDLFEALQEASPSGPKARFVLSRRLPAGLNLKGGSEDARLLDLLCRHDPKAGAELCRQALDSGSH